MRNLRATAVAAVACAFVGTAAGGLPPLGGPMNHVMVSLGADSAFAVHAEQGGPMMLIEAPETYDGAAAVLNGTRFNAQYGWLVSGLWAPPPGGFVEIRVVESSPGLRVYCGRAFGGMSFMEPVLGTDGSAPAFNWDGAMLHNFYSATMPGVYEATYRVSIVDGAGEAIDGYEPGEVSLSWEWATDCAADLAAPFGVLDLSDVTAFVTAFIGMMPGADVAEPSGVFDLSDISTFANTFAGGCP